MKDRKGCYEILSSECDVAITLMKPQQLHKIKLVKYLS